MELEKRKSRIQSPGLLRDIRIHNGNLERQELVEEAEIPNTDIGYVEPGQEADIKIDTYKYQKYGRQCSVEVKTDRRRVIAFFLEPLADALAHSLKVRQGSIAERRIL